MAKEVDKSPTHLYLPVNHDDEGSCDDSLSAPFGAREHKSTSRRYHICLLLVFLLSSILMNLAFSIQYIRQSNHKTCDLAQGQTPYAGLKFDTPVTYHSFTKYWDPTANQSIANDAWDAINTDPVAVALSDTYARQHGLSESTRFPWDTERSVYYVKGLHDLHCLKLLRKHLVTTPSDNGPSISMDHLFHCLDALRQDVICTADDTPMPAAKAHLIGDGQTRQCRSWDKLLQWALLPDQNACHKFDDYREVTNSLELFTFCPADSPYSTIMTSYFDIHGHKDLYEEKDGKELLGR